MIRTLNNNGKIYDFKYFQILHSYFFDSAWLCYDGVSERLNPQSVCMFEEFTGTKLIDEGEFNIKKFFPGSFGYHIHIKNAQNYFSNNSYFYYFEKHFKRILKI